MYICCSSTAFVEFLPIEVLSIEYIVMKDDLDQIIGNALYVVLKSQTLDIPNCYQCHYIDVIMGTMASQITSLTIVYSAV